MPSVSGNIPNFLNGVSQQDPTLRLPNQFSEMTNAYAAPDMGCGKRPGTRHVARLLSEADSSAHVSFIVRDGTERYVVYIKSGSCRVFTIAGIEIPVSATADAVTYLASASPRTDFRLLPIADTTLVLNRSVSTALASTTSPAALSEALIWVRSGNYGTKYQVRFNGVLVSYTTSDTDPLTIRTENIASQLLTALQAAVPDPANYTFTTQDSTIYIKRNDGTSFLLEPTDSSGGRGLVVIKGSIQTFTDLPPVASAGFVVKVEGDAGSAIDDYWVIFQPTNSSATIGAGLWAECPKPGTQIALDPTTMPYSLIRQQDELGNISFDLQATTWAERTAGDDEAMPAPSFVGRPINDLLLYRNRLFLLSNGFVNGSRTSSFFNFWPATAQTTLDDDPLDVTYANSRVSNVKTGVEFSGDLVLLTEDTQLQLDSQSGPLTPQSIRIAASTSYSADGECKPILAGSRAAFSFQSGSYSGLYEYYADPFSGARKIDENSSHAPRYLTGRIFALDAFPSDNFLSVLTDGSRSTVFTYRWEFQGADKVQSCWSKWTFNGTVLGTRFIDTSMYLVIAANGETCLERLSMDLNASDPGASFSNLLDQRIAETGVTSRVYDSVSNTTTVVLPFTPRGTVVAVDRSTAHDGAVITQPSTASGTQVYLQGDWSTAEFYIGCQYTMTVTLSQPFVRKQSSTGRLVAELNGRLTIRKYQFRLRQSAALTASVTVHGVTYDYPLGHTATLGTVEFRDAIFPVPIGASEFTLTLSNDSHLPCWITSADWEGSFHPRGSRG